MATLSDIVVKSELRSCTVNGELGYFHCWEHFSRPLASRPTIGGPLIGEISGVWGIVEFADGVKSVYPSDIKFCDETNAYLQAMKKHKEVKENG